MVERLPPDLRPRMRPPRKDELYLEAMPCQDGDVPLQSSIIVATAGGKEVWRSMTLRSCHLSEYAFFPYPEQTLLGIMQCVPDSPDSMVIIESTAEGMGNDFHKQYVRAENGESSFVPVFIPWYDCPDSTRRVPPDVQLDAEEAEMKKRLSLTDEQMAWRQETLATRCDGSLDKFAQEYPTTSSGAFLSTGLPAFDNQKLTEMYEKARKKEPERGEWTERGYIAMRNGRLAVWARPKEGHEYTIGADVATGVKDGDLSVAHVFDRTTNEQVGEWAGWITPIEFAHILLGLGKWYNFAILAPEINTHGFAVIDEIK